MPLENLEIERVLTRSEIHEVTGGCATYIYVCIYDTDRKENHQDCKK